MDIDQSQRLQADQVENNAGGFVWKIDNFNRFRRFLVLGSEQPTYYATAKELSVENVTAIFQLLQDGRGIDVVEEIVKFSEGARTPKQDPLILSLAICARKGDLETKQKAYKVLTNVCRIPTHLFMFVGFCEKLSSPSTGWGRAHRNAIKSWYIKKEPMKLAMDITKYQKREGWSHRDLARLMHLKPNGADLPDHLPCILKYIVRGWEETREAFLVTGIDQNTNNVLEFLRAVEEIKGLNIGEHEERIVQMIEQYKLVREHVPTSCLNSVEVWRALLKKMPMTAMIRNLGKMTSVGLLGTGSIEATLVSQKLTNEGLLRYARIHPFNVLLALKQYQTGHGDKGKLSWTPNPEIIRALEDAFYKSFKNIQPTNQRHLLALDVSGSMKWGGCVGTPSITPAAASAAMAMVTARTEHSHEFVAFSDRMVPLAIDQNMNLEDVLTVIDQVPMGGTDCALPMTYATENKLEIDVFVIYTDCETRAGVIHPSEALRKYRQQSGINAKLVVVAMTSNGFTIADPEDAGMLDMAGFDSAAPQVMREFIEDTI